MKTVDINARCAAVLAAVEELKKTTTTEISKKTNIPQSSVRVYLADLMTNGGYVMRCRGKNGWEWTPSSSPCLLQKYWKTRGLTSVDIEDTMSEP